MTTTAWSRRERFWPCWIAVRATLNELKAALPDAWTSLTMSPYCDDELKYGVLERIVKEYCDLADAGGEILGRKILEAITVNGVRVHLEDGSWVLVRAS